jgi:hypothetical protein
MISEKIKSMLDDYKPTSEATIIVTVGLQCDKLVAVLSSSVMNEMVRVAGAAGARLLDDLSAEDIRKYLCTLGWLRRLEAAQVRQSSAQAYRRLAAGAAVPTMWYQALIMIGEAIDRDYSIKFVPGTTIDSGDLSDPEEMQRISDLMFLLQDNGLKVVAGIPRGAEGELDFMAMCHADEVVKSYRRCHPVYGFYASFFASHEVSVALGTLVRVTYGFDSDYQTLIRRVLASSGGGE